MGLITLFRREIKEPITKILILIILTGITNMLIVEIVSVAAANVGNHGIIKRHLLLFILITFIAFYSKKYVYVKSIAIIEKVVYKIRKRIAHKIRQTELSTFEAVGSSDIYARLSQDVLYISTASWYIVTIIQALVITFFMVLYVAVLSKWTFILVVLGVSFTTIYFITNHKRWTRPIFKQLSRKDTEFFEKLEHILKGYKEIKVNKRKNKGVMKAYGKVNHERRVIKNNFAESYNDTVIHSMAFLYFVIALIVFIVPQYYESHAEVLIKMTAAILFLLGPIESALNSISAVTLADNGADNILDLETKLDRQLQQQKRKNTIQGKKQQVISFQKNIHLKQLVYTYSHTNSNQAFSIGPMTLTIPKGEIIFVTGGNGSGKSTFLKMFTGLYTPNQGCIYLDWDAEKEKGIRIDNHNYEAYSELFTLIFTDFHLFDKLYGLEDIDEKEVNDLMVKMDLPQEKTSYRNGGFTNIKLSSGQKKRLALVTSILEDKDIYIYDEVAADLDPWFRDVYYYEILSNLKARNKTIFVVSHDKEYWAIADRILFMEKGQLRELTETEIDEHHAASAKTTEDMVRQK